MLSFFLRSTIYFLFILVISTRPSAFAQAKTDSFLEKLLKDSEDTAIKKVIADPGIYRLQIVYTKIERDRNNRPQCRNFYYNHDPAMYFNPASMVKLPLAILALEKLNNIKIPAVNKYTHMRFDSSYPGQVAAYSDTTAATGKPSIAHYIKKAFLISDNDAYNRLYQFVGQRWIDSALRRKGYTGTRIIRQFMGYTEEENRHTNEISFIDNAGMAIYRQPAAYNTDSFYFPRVVKIGDGYINRLGNLIREPFDFTRQNKISLEHLTLMLQAVVFPGTVEQKMRFELTSEDRKFLLQYLSQYPSETDDPKYSSSLFYDSYVKFFFRDSTRQMPEGVRVFNKVGWAYGFLTDVAYVADFDNRVEYFLAATLYVNSDGVLNDNRYDYDQVGYPFFRALGKAIHAHELKRKRTRKPDLSPLTFRYDKRDPKDKRPEITEVDN